jgi:hypothetical protein
MEKHPQLDAFGPGAGAYVNDKTEALAPYMFSVVFENCRQDMYFTEKLIDCFLTGTVPIYWGPPRLEESHLFNNDGILYIQGDSCAALDAILPQLSEKWYYDHLGAIVDNFHRGMNYRITEDRLWKHIQSELRRHSYA